MRSTSKTTPGVAVSHAGTLTDDICGLFAGPNAAKRMAQAIQCSARTCESYLARRRRLSLDAAIELAARDEQAMTALLARVAAARARNAELQAAVRQGAHVDVGAGIERGGLGLGVRGPAGGPGQGGGVAAAATVERRTAERRGRGA